MKKILLLVVLSVLLICPKNSYALWVWTPETNKWENPKYAVKDTPKDQLAFALGFFEKGDYKKASSELNKLIKNYPRAREAAEAQYYLAQILEKQNKVFEAFKSYQTVIEKYPFSERAGEIVKRQYEIGLMLLEGKVKKNKILHTVSGGDYDVVEIFRTVIKNAPYGELAAPAQYKIGQYLLEKEMYQEARDEFEKTMNDYPDSEWAKAARFQVAIADSKRSTGVQYDQKVTESAIEEFSDFAKENPEVDLSEKAKEQVRELREKEAQKNFLVAEFYIKQKQYSAAKVYLTKIADDYQNTSWAPKALAKIRELNQQYPHAK